MPEQTVLLRKKCGGSAVTYGGVRYEWPEDSSVAEVPYDLAMRLLGVQDGDYCVAGEPSPPRGVTGVAPASVQSAHSAGLGGSEEGADEDEVPWEVTEPAPGDEHKVTEPAPKAGGEVAEAPESGGGSPVTPKPRAGTRRTTPARRTAAKK